GGEVDRDARRVLAQAVAPDRVLAARRGEHVAPELDDLPRLLGERDEFERRDPAEARMLPAQQRLGALDAAGAQVDDRLVEDVDLAARDRAAQRALDAGARARAGAQCRTGELGGAAAAPPGGGPRG